MSRSPLEVPVAVVIAIDPQMSGSGRGSDMPVLALAEWEDGTVEFIKAVKRKVRSSQTLSHRIDTWEGAIRELLTQIEHRKGWRRPAVACENARGVGGTGYTLQALVHHIRDMCRDRDDRPEQWPQALGLRFFSVGPTEMKSRIAGSGKASKEEVANAVWLSIVGANELPPGDGWTDAAGIGLFALGEMRIERLGAESGS